MAVAGTSFDRSFPLELDAQHRSAFAKAGDRNGQPYVFKIKGWPFWWWMRNASEVSLRAVSEADSPGVLRLLWSAAESQRTCLRANVIWRPRPTGRRLGAARYHLSLQRTISIKASKLHSIPICLSNLKDKKFDFFSKTPCIFFERCYYYSCG